MKLAFIGGGVMGEAMISGVLKNGLAKPQDVAVCDLLSQRRDYLSSTYEIKALDKPAPVLEGADIAVLAVKPQEFPEAAREISIKSGQTVMSIMAGVTIATIHDALKHDAIVRAIPNTPARIGEGMTVWTATDAVPQAARDEVQRVLAVLGHELYVDDEKYVNMATAVSSSGPAYIFLVMEALIDGAVHIGVRRDMAQRMIIQTVLGSAKYAEATGKHLADLRNEVTSPAGTTTEGLRALEKAGMRLAFIEAVQAAYDKAKRLGG
ncbi:MAG: pyrroline-5-carboxylate reductase [Chloroflexi bacterium]|nr:pyrroline-5-carboxylate reductase [Chloroflexota bacterium]